MLLNDEVLRQLEENAPTLQSLSLDDHEINDDVLL